MTMPSTAPLKADAVPDALGHFGAFGGRFVPETLIPALDQLTAEYEAARNDPAFVAELEGLSRDWIGRPSPLYYAQRLTERIGGARIYLKREDLNHTGAHKINHALPQALLAKRMGKPRIVAETGAGQHGVATASVCAMLKLECVVYMGEVDIARQQPNVFRMRLLGAEVHPVSSGSRTLKDAINEAIRDWVTNVRTTHYLLGSVVGPHPYPQMNRDFQSVIGKETRQQVMAAAGRLPDAVVACVGGGSNAIGMFHPFVEDEGVRLLGIEAAGHGIESGQHAATLSVGQVGVLHGARSFVLQDEHGQIVEPHSISAGLDYPGVGPEHSFLKQLGRAEYRSATDEQALQAFQLLCETEGIIPALESSHALAGAVELARGLPRDGIIVVNLSGRGDKDLQTVASALGLQI